jgi:hypothetical protein
MRSSPWPRTCSPACATWPYPKASYVTPPRYRLLHLPARLTRGQRKRWLHLRADWPWTDDVINTWRAVRALPAPP